MTERIERITEQTPIESNQLYRQDFIVERVLSITEQEKLKEQFKLNAPADMGIIKIEYDNNLMSVYFMRQPFIELSPGIDTDQDQETGSNLQTPEGFNVLIKGTTRAIPAIVYYAVSALVIALSGIAFFSYTKSGLYKVFTTLTSKETGIFNPANIKDLLITGGSIFGGLMILYAIFKIISRSKK